MYRLPSFPECWANQLDMRALSAALATIQERLNQVALETEVAPPAHQVFQAFARTDPDTVRCVLVGQDPYHGQGQAMGLSFSVPPGQAIPPSLKNLFHERTSDLGLIAGASGDLTAWADAGVLLLNRVLTVRLGMAGSHRSLGWEALTDAVIETLSARQAHCVFVLWGKDAQALRPLIRDHHTCLSGVHPSPLSAYRGFFGSRPFSRVNAALIAHGQEPLSWTLPGDHGLNSEGHTPQLF
jgi:uracil-DNA glycosylase